jgi:hypothetical protein
MSTTALAPVLLLVAILAADLWVWSDARAQSERGTPVVASVGRLQIDTPSTWFIGCLVLFVVFFPLYLAARGKG